MTQYGLSSCKRLPGLDILGGCLWEIRLYVHFEHVVNSIPLFLFLLLAPCYLFCNGLMDHLCLCANLGSPFRPFPHTPHPPFNSTLVCLFFFGWLSSLISSLRLFWACTRFYFKLIFVRLNRPFARSGHMVQNHTCW